MAKGQQKIVIPPPVPGTPEYYYNLRAGRDLLPMEKRLGMVRDPNYKYEYTCDNKTPFRYSLALYSFIILILYFSCTNISIPEPDRPIVLQMSFGDSESEDLIDTIEVENLGIQSDVVSEDVGSTDQIVELEPEPEPETNNFEEYWASIQPEESGEPIEDQSDSTAEAGKVISTMTGAIGQATSSNHAVASRYGSGDSMEMRLAKIWFKH